jgi:hypothetical protein
MKLIYIQWFMFMDKVGSKLMNIFSNITSGYKSSLRSIINTLIKYNLRMEYKTDDECITTFNDLKFRKIDARYVVYELSKDGAAEHLV